MGLLLEPSRPLRIRSRSPDLRSAAAFIRGAAGANGRALLTHIVGAAAYAGKRVRIAADMKSVGVEQYAGLGFEVLLDDQPGPSAFRQDLRGTNDWERRAVVFDLPANAVVVAFGFGLSGPGAVWADNFSIDVVDGSVEPTPLLPLRPTRLDFER